MISTLIGEIYRVVRCTSTESDKEDALGDLKELFLRNEYPERLKSTKVAELRSRDFKPLGNREEREQERRDDPGRFYDFQSHLLAPGVKKF